MNKMKPRGVILLITLLTFTVIVGATLAAAALVLRALRSSNATDDKLRASALAAGGIEDALYHLRKEGPSLLPGHETIKYTTGERVTRTITFGENHYQTDLAVGSSYEFGMYDPPAAGGDVEALAFAWNDACDGASLLQIQWVSDWLPGSPPVNWGAKGVSSQSHPPVPTPVVITNFISGKSYRVRLTALGCGISHLTMDAYADDAQSKPAKNMQTRTAVESKATVGGFTADQIEYTKPYDALPVP